MPSACSELSGTGGLSVVADSTESPTELTLSISYCGSAAVAAGDDVDGVWYHVCVDMAYVAMYIYSYYIYI